MDATSTYAKGNHDAYPHQLWIPHRLHCTRSNLGNAKISELNGSRAREEDVHRLEVSVKNVLIVDVAQRGSHLRKPSQRQRGRVARKKLNKGKQLDGVGCFNR